MSTVAQAARVAAFPAERAERARLVTYRGLVYPWHCDHMGHMNVMWYAGKFDEASWQFLAQLGLTQAHLQQNGLRMAAVEQTTQYRAELFAGDAVTISTELVEVGEVGEKSLRFVHTMRKEGSDATAATSALVGVQLDALTRRACALAPDVRERAMRMLDP